MPSARPRQRLGLLLFGAAFFALFLGFAIAQGIGSGAGVPPGAVAVVEGVPTGIGTITERDYDRAFAQVVRQAGLKTTPGPGDPQYEELEETAMTGLLAAVWRQGQAAEMGIALKPGRVIKSFRAVKAEEFGTEAEYRKFLRTSLVNREELVERVRLQLLSSEIERLLGAAALTPSAGEVEAYYEEAKATQYTRESSGDGGSRRETLPLARVRSEIVTELMRAAERERSDEFLAEFTEKWTSRTFCDSDHAVEGCSNVKWMGRPAGPPACYEASPEGEAPQDCPAPVRQPRPALPGTVSILEPQGEQLAQRPRPQG